MYTDNIVNEIVFKGINKSNNEWVYGSYFYSNKTHYIINSDIETVKIAGLCNVEHSNINKIEIWGNTLCQFIGYYDQKDKKIFNRDKVKYHYNGNDYISEIIYTPNRLIICDKPYHVLNDGILYNCNVVGNIFDHQ